MPSVTRANPKSKTSASRKRPSNPGAKSNPSPAGKSSAAKGQPNTQKSHAANEQAQIQSANAAQNGEAMTGANTHSRDASPNGGKAASASSQTQTPTAAYSLLQMASETLEDVERVRIAAENRARALVHPEQRICLPEDHPTVLAAKGLAEQLAEVEHTAEVAVKKTVRQTPIAEWLKSDESKGVGEKQAGRLLGVIGNPRMRIDGETGEVHERTVGQLWSYCGYAVRDGVAPRRKRGEQGNWNTKARMRAFLIAESCIKTKDQTKYRILYDQAREKYAESVHEHPCAQCGVKGKPAQPGTELRDGHKHARALRIVAKEVLKDLWLAADQVSFG